MLNLFMSIRFAFKVLYLLVLIGLNQWLHLDHLFLFLPEACFLGFWEGFCGGEDWGITHCPMSLSLVYSHLYRPESFISGKGRDYTFTPWRKYYGLCSMIFVVCVYALHGPYGQFYVYHAVSKYICIEPKMKSHTGLISPAIFCNLKIYLIRHFYLLFFPT